MTKNGRERKILYCGIGIAKLGKRRERKLNCGNGVTNIGEKREKKNCMVAMVLPK